jgi:hypothetical protein
MVRGIDRHPRFQRLAEYLASKAPPGKLPGRQHIDPLEIPDLLPYVMLIDVMAQQVGPPRYRLRLVGTEVVKIQGSDNTGRYVEDVLTATEGEAIRSGYDEILRSHQAEYHSGVVATPGREHVAYERIAFPLAADGEHVSMLILVFVEGSASGR